MLHFPLKATFLAVPLDGAAKGEFQRLQDAIRAYEDLLSFQSQETPHVTLQYWPSIMEIEYHQIVRQASKIALSSTPFTLKMEGIGTFSSRGDDRVVFLDVPFSEDFARLKKRCPWPSLEPFHPHITLARIRHPQRFRIVKKKVMKLIDDMQFAMIVDRLRLYADVEGRKQTPLQNFVFSRTTS